MAKSRTKLGLVIGLCLAATLSVLILAMMQQAKVRCEVCMTFDGRTQCRRAAGPNRKEATKTATDNACAYISSGMTDSIRCSNTPPDSVQCSE